MIQITVSDVRGLRTFLIHWNRKNQVVCREVSDDERSVACPSVQLYAHTPCSYQEAIDTGNRLARVLLQQMVQPALCANQQGLSCFSLWKHVKLELFTDYGPPSFHRTFTLSNANAHLFASVLAVLDDYVHLLMQTTYA